MNEYIWSRIESLAIFLSEADETVGHCANIIYLWSLEFQVPAPCLKLGETPRIAVGFDNCRICGISSMAEEINDAYEWLKFIRRYWDWNTTLTNRAAEKE